MKPQKGLFPIWTCPITAVDLKGKPTGRIAQFREFIGQRHSYSLNIKGLKDGHGNKIKGEK